MVCQRGTHLCSHAAETPLGPRRRDVRRAHGGQRGAPAQLVCQHGRVNQPGCTRRVSKAGAVMRGCV